MNVKLVFNINMHNILFKYLLKIICLSQIFFFCTEVYGQDLSQNVTINLKGATLKEFFKQMEKQSSFTIIYRDVVISEVKDISVNVKNKPVSSVLEQVLSPRGLTYQVTNKTLVILKSGGNLGPQESKRKITGRVRDEFGEAVIGANVFVKGSSTGTTTDLDGRYELNVGDGDALQFTFIGYVPQEVRVGAAPVINVTIKEDVRGLDEVVVVGYGTQKKLNVTGSIAQISAKDLVKAPMTSVTNMLAGKLPGLISTQNSGQPGSDQSSMVIRGAGTFNDSSPLLLVDGVERSFNAIDPNDVESVSILKDAASASVYGVRAAHGVILVKTKRGSTDGKSSIKYSGSYTFSTNTRFPKFLNGVDYAKWHNKARELDGNEGYFSDEEIDKIQNGDPDGVLGNTDWTGALFKDFGGTQQHNISIIGGTDKFQYFVSGGMMDQDGIIPNSSFKRYNLRSNMDVQITNELRFSVDMAGRNEDRDNPGFNIAPNNEYNPITQAIRVLPIIPKEYNGLPTATGEGASTWNPLAGVNDSGFSQNDRSVFESSASLEYKVPFIKGLKAKMFFSFDKNYTETKTFLNKYNVAKYDPATGTYATTQADGTGTSSLFQSSSSGQMLMSRPSVEYVNTFGVHDLGVLFLYEYRETRGRSFQASRRNFLLDAIPELPFAQEDTPNSVKGGSSNTKTAGYVGRLNYSYNKRYLAEFSFRYDGSYKFHEDYRWGFFPSFSAGWVMSEESFFKDAFPKVDKFKIRASVGELGRDNISDFLYKRFFSLTSSPSYAFGNVPDATYVLYTTNSVPSYNLTWEKTRTVNLGMEFVAWNGLLSADLDVFYKYTHDILEKVAGLYPPSISNNYPTIRNSGVVDARGVELVLGHRNKVGDVFYSVNGNVTWARNKVLSRTQNANIPMWKNIIGKPIGGVYGFHALGLYQTEEQLQNRPSGPGGVQRLGDLMYEDINGDGKIDLDDQIRIAGSHTPEMMFSLNAEATWKGFDIGLQFQGAAFCDIITSGLYPNGVMDQTEFARAFYGGGNSPYYLVEGSWTPENTNAKYPRLGQAWNGNNGWTSDWWVVDGSYLRLKNAQIGYSLPKKVINRLHAQNMRVYVAGTNLFTLDGLDFMDPEMPSNNNGYYPQQRTYSVGIDLTF